MQLLWEERAREEYCYWQTQDKKTLKRINILIKEMQRSPHEGAIIIASCRGHYDD